VALSGKGVVVIWNDITQEGRENFLEWHDREHIPERVGIPGFLRGRRYGALAGAPEYFTIYEVRDRGVLTGADYLSRLNSPTEWTTRSVQHFRNTSRSLCHIEISFGIGSGGFVGTVRFDCDEERDATLLARLSQVLPSIRETAAICAVHVCRADPDASAQQTAEQRGRAANMIPRWVMIVEGVNREAVDRIFSAQLTSHVLGDMGARQAVFGVYQLQSDIVAA
jgi:hypothetical protein